MKLRWLKIKKRSDKRDDNGYPIVEVSVKLQYFEESESKNWSDHGGDWVDVPTVVIEE